MNTSRRRGMKAAGIALLATAFLIALPAVALADEHAPVGVSDETQFILNTFAFLVWGALVMWMCAGFTMLESGAVRTKNASMICLKNIGIYSIAGLAYYFIGYNLMYVDVGDMIGSFKFLYSTSDAEIALLDGAAGSLGRRWSATATRSCRTGSSRWYSSPPPRRSSQAPSPSGSRCGRSLHSR